MTTPQQPVPEEHEGPDDWLEPGEIVTVHCDHEAHRDTPSNQAFVIIDNFQYPEYAMAALGGDGLECRNQPREWLQPVSPAQLRQDHDADGTVSYVID